jgi:FAD dependent oxidoreductase TIGR03364
VVVERDERAVGASIRNFGHICTTAQAGLPLEYAMASRETWLRIAPAAGAWLREAGAVVVARATDEEAVLAEFAADRGCEQVRLLTAREIESRTGIATATAGAFLPLDLRVDSRTAVPALTAWLAGRGVRFLWSTSVLDVEAGRVRTTRGDITGEQVFVAVGHNVDRLLPEVADDAGVMRCALHMLAVDSPGGRTIPSAVLSGHSLLRYDGFAACPSAELVRARFSAERPDTVAAGLNLMFTQRPDGRLILGDTHEYARTPGPFNDETLDRLVLDETAALLNVDSLTVRQRWRGVYASAPSPYLVAEPEPDLQVVSVTSGIGMTTAFGLTAAVFAGIRCAVNPKFDRR